MFAPRFRFLPTALAVAVVVIGGTFAAARSASGPAETVLEVRGAVPRPRAWTLDSLQALGADTVSWDYRDVTRRVVGVRLDKVLAACGWDRGPMDRGTPARLKRAGLRRAIVATAPDSFAAVFSAGELDPIVGATRAYVVWVMDGAPLAQEFGRLRLAVVTDREPSRSIHDVRTLRVVDLSN
jgi:hypothetical protein